MKKLMFFAGVFCLQFGLCAAAPSSIPPSSADARAKTHFRMNFSDVQDAIWHVNADDNMYCSFRRGEAVDRVFYDNQGYWQYTVVGYSSSLLDTDIKNQVLKEFSGYKITYVNEIRSDYSEPLYMINIENSENIKVLRCVGGEIGEYQSLKKR